MEQEEEQTRTKNKVFEEKFVSNLQELFKNNLKEEHKLKVTRYCQIILKMDVVIMFSEELFRCQTFLLDICG